MQSRVAILVLPMLVCCLAQTPAQETPSEDSFLSLLGTIFTLPVQVTYKLFSPIDADGLSTSYRRAGFSQKDQDYFQLNWYAERRMGYSGLFERKELEEQIQREGFGVFRDR